MLAAHMKKLLFIGLLSLFAFALPSFRAQALSGNEYIMASQPDDSFFCAPNWRDCFTGGIGNTFINLGKGSIFGDGTLKSVTIAKDPSSPYKYGQWIIEILCFTDSSYTTRCNDWLAANNWNGTQTHVVSEIATSTPDNKYWTADFTNKNHNANSDGTSPVRFMSNHYYQLQINDNGWAIGAYGSESLGIPYYKITGVKNKADPVVIIPGILGSWEKNGQWILDPMAHVYDNLVDTLKANGFVENQTLFTFPYDWEKSNVDTAKLLAQKISQIKTICGCSKVDLVAHSMGGLVATQYIMSSDYKDDVDQFFMLGTPLAGSPKAYKAWEAGEVDFGDPRINVFMQRVFDREAKDGNYASVLNYIHQKPVSSVQELLPVLQNYLTLGSAILQFPTGYPQNTFLQNLIGNVVVYRNKVLNKVQTYVVTGDTGSASTTIGFVIKSSTQLPKWQDGEIVSEIGGGGDSTVPLASASYFSQADKNLNGIEHKGIPDNSSEYVFTKLTGISPGIVIKKQHGPFDVDWALAAGKIAPTKSDFVILAQTLKDAFSDSVANHTWLFLMLFSPIDLKVTAPDGTQIGKGAGQISNAIYSGPLDEYEYILIQDPMPGQYKVETIGTGNGAFGLAVGRIDSATTTYSVISGTTTVNQIISNTLFFSSTSTAITLVGPVATSTPTITPITPDTCVTDITKAYQNKWITKKPVYENLVFDCKALKELFKGRDQAKTNLAKNLVATSIKLVLADMDLLAKDKGNTKDAVLLITKITSWFRTHNLL
jgi:pimeloyl-ACP methyl ester carboxylesterase